MSVLILGGTGEAAAVTELAVAEKRWHVLTSLAGRTKEPRPLPGDVRVGGFGGVDGLAQYMQANNVTTLVDATHPFAVAISQHSKDACERLGVPRMMLGARRGNAGPKTTGSKSMALPRLQSGYHKRHGASS